MAKRICALEGCGNEFEPNALNQMHCSKNHANLHRVRKFRARHRRNNGGGDGGGSGPNGGLHATLGGAVSYGLDGSTADHSRYYVN